jgi:hypothetical protein
MARAGMWIVAPITIYDLSLARDKIDIWVKSAGILNGNVAQKTRFHSLILSNSNGLH